MSRLNKIAKQNDDEFRCSIRVEQDRKGFRYVFECIETADRHVLIFGAGPDIESAVKDAADDIPDILELWGYTESA